MKKINIGLDIGIASVGWSITSAEPNDYKILDAGSRLFEEANSSNSKNSSKSDRRAQRGRRRNLRRLKLRKKDLIDIFKKYNLLENNQSFWYLSNNKDLLELRVKALSKSVTKEELMLILFNFIKHRGTFNIKDEIREQLSENIDANSNPDDYLNIFKDSSLLPCEKQLKYYDQNGYFRGQNNFYITHQDLLKEIEKILSVQIKNNLINDNFKNEYLKIFNRKREYYIGPGKGSPYGWDEKEENFFNTLIGRDTYDVNEKRAPKQGLTSYIFNLLNDLNNLKVNNEKLLLSYENKIELIKLTIDNSTTKNITLKDIAKITKIDENDISGYRIDKEGKPIFTKFESINKIRHFLKKKENDISWIKFENWKELDEIIDILTVCQSYDTSFNKLKQLNYSFLTDPIIENLAYLSFSATHSLSNKTMKLLIEEMLHNNIEHMQALKELGIKRQYKFSDKLKEQKYIPILRKEINELYISPVVKRALLESIKIIQEIQKNYEYEINSIVIELAREKNSDEYKNYINNQQKNNAKDNREINNIIQNTAYSKKDFSPRLRKKLKLLKEQDGNCPYCDKPIETEKVIQDEFYTEIDHIIPESISFDSSLTNLVLVHKQENSIKGQKTPYKYFNDEQGSAAYEQFKLRVLKIYEKIKFNNRKYYLKKINNLLLEHDINDPNWQREFVQRNLNDTRYATKEVKEYLEYYIKSNNLKWKIYTINGSFTNYLRYNFFKIGAKNREEYHHHAMDATMISFLPQIKFSASKSVLDIDNEDYQINLNYDSTGAHQLLASIGNDILAFPYKYSWKIQNKNNKNLSDETIYAAKVQEDGTLKKILKLNLITGDSKNIKKYFEEKYTDLLIYQSDKKTFDYLKGIYNEYINTKYIDENTKKEKNVDNPFYYFVKVLNQRLEKQSNEEKKPLIKNLRYIADKANSYLDISHKYEKVKKGKKVIKTALNWIYCEWWYSKLFNKYALIPMNANMFINIEKRIINEENYNKKKTELKIDDTYELVTLLYKYDEIMYKYDDDVKNCLFIGFDSNNNRIENKYLSCKTEKRWFSSISKIKEFKKITSNSTKTKITIVK